jgi:hypothetical protein
MLALHRQTMLVGTACCVFTFVFHSLCAFALSRQETRDTSHCVVGRFVEPTCGFVLVVKVFSFVAVVLGATG